MNRYARMRRWCATAAVLLVGGVSACSSPGSTPGPGQPTAGSNPSASGGSQLPDNASADAVCDDLNTRINAAIKAYRDGVVSLGDPGGDPTSEPPDIATKWVNFYRDSLTQSIAALREDAGHAADAELATNLKGVADDLQGALDRLHTAQDYDNTNTSPYYDRISSYCPSFSIG